MEGNILILGAGIEGQAAARYIAGTNPEADVSIADANDIHFEIAGVTNLFGEHYPTSLEQWDIVVVSPGIPPHTPLLATAKEITTPTNWFFEYCNGTIIGVTGSKGKSTTSSLIYSILKHAGKPVHLVGNIGNPALDVLAEHNESIDLFVYELSSYQLRLLEEGPRIAVITSLFPDHTSYHGTIEQYYTDKLRITTTQTKENIVVYNAQYPELEKRITQSAARSLGVPHKEGAHRKGDELFVGTEEIMNVEDIPLQGEHNVSNVLLALMTTHELGIHWNDMREAVKKFESLPHRLEHVGTYRDIHFIDDSLATAPEPTMAALDAIDNVGTLFLGGSADRGYDFSALAARVVERKVPNVVLFADSGTDILLALQTAGFTGTYIETRSMQEAMKFAYQHTKPGQTVLLSCASPSFSLFKNYKDRGEQFRAAAKELA